MNVTGFGYNLVDRVGVQITRSRMTILCGRVGLIRYLVVAYFVFIDYVCGIPINRVNHEYGQGRDLVANETSG